MLAGQPLVSVVVLVPQRMPALPPAREFVTSAGFGGAAALFAALLLAAVILIGLRGASKRDRLQREQHERHCQQELDAQRHTAAVERCWQRLVWVVETAGIEPASSQGATLGLGPELALEILRGLLRDADVLGDDTLAGAVTVYLNQFSLVMAQQSGSLSGLAVAASPPSVEDKQQAAAPVPAAVAPSESDDVPDDAKKVAVAGRRRRR